MARKKEAEQLTQNLCRNIIEKITFKPGVNKLIIEFNRETQLAYVVQMDKDKELSNHNVEV